MKNLHPKILIKELILEKEAEHLAEGRLFKEHFLLTYESLKPINIIKNTFKEAISSSDIRTDAVNTAIGLTTGFIAKKVFAGHSQNALSAFLGIILEMVVASKVTKNADAIKSTAGIILKRIMNQQGNSETTI